MASNGEVDAYDDDQQHEHQYAEHDKAVLHDSEKHSVEHAPAAA